MKITCTRKEYEAMLFALGRSTECVVEIGYCPVGDCGENITCEECVMKNIDWEVTN